MSEDKFNEIINDDRLDKLLDEIYSREVLPSQELVKKTKASLTKPGLLEYILTISIITGFIVNLFSVYIIIFKLHSFTEKIIAISLSSIITNIIIIVIFLYRNDIKDLFHKYEI